MSGMAHILPDLSQPPGPSWHCTSCGTAVTWAAVDDDPGMQMCPRCGKWMDRDETQSPAFIAKAAGPGPTEAGA